ncbi:MAG: rod shape-determining protein MreC [Vicinamibacterales bacterium]
MSLLDFRQRSGYLFLAVIVGHVILISAQVNSRGGVPVLEAVTFGAFSEAQRGTSSVVGAIRDVWNRYLALRAVRDENDTLQRELASARVKLQEQAALLGRAEGLARLLDLKGHTSLSTTAAAIIASGATSDFRTVTLDKGSVHGLSKDMAVIVPSGVVGRVVLASARASKVQLLIDRNAAAGALIERSRAQGVVVGAGEDTLRLDFVSEVSDVVVGDQVVTSGIDGIFPKGFAIGRVSDVQKSGGAYRRISVQPAVGFGSLEDVLVVLTPTQAALAATVGSTGAAK